MITARGKKFLFPTEEEIINDYEVEEIVEEEEVDTSEQQTKIVKPELFEDAKFAAECMINGIPTVVVDLSYIVNEENGKRTAERIIDFLYGVSLPLKLYVTRVNETTFIFSVEHLKD